MTNNTINFSKAYLTYRDDALKLRTSENGKNIDELLHDILLAQFKHVEASLRSCKYVAEVKDHISMINIHDYASSFV